jgi:hypothetical protein
MIIHHDAGIGLTASWRLFRVDDAMSTLVLLQDRHCCNLVLHFSVGLRHGLE